VLIWLLNKNERIKELAKDINYLQGDYAISVESIKEFIYLIQSGKINTDISFDELVEALNKKQISIYGYDKYTLKKLSELPYKSIFNSSFSLFFLLLQSVIHFVGTFVPFAAGK
jgi:PIN domain nuclease of toxin-antitoxin system